MENREYWSGTRITSLKENEIFVLGANSSNLIKVVHYIVQNFKTLHDLLSEKYKLKIIKGGFCGII